MWNQDELKLPEDWFIYQQITIIDGSTFDLYVQNMKPLLEQCFMRFRACNHEPL